MLLSVSPSIILAVCSDSFVLADSCCCTIQVCLGSKKACGLFAAGQGEHPLLPTAASLLCVQSKHRFFTQLHYLVLVKGKRILSPFNVKNEASEKRKLLPSRIIEAVILQVS